MSLKMMILSKLIDIKNINNRANGRAQIERALDRSVNDEKVLVFCSKKQICDVLSEIYDAPKYYSDAPNKKSTLENWKKGLMTATGSLGAGVDIGKILDIFHWGIPTGMINFDQEVGRGGRGGETVQSIILLSEREFKKLFNTESSLLSPDEAGLQELIIRMDCRRMQISSFMDGEEHIHTCESIDGEVCDRCGGIMSETERKIRGLQNTVQASLFVCKNNE